MRRKFRLPNIKKCPKTGKSMYKDEGYANRIKFRIWTRDPHADMKDLHTYLCPDCKHYHVGHKSYYQKSLQGATA